MAKVMPGLWMFANIQFPFFGSNVAPGRLRSGHGWPGVDATSPARAVSVQAGWRPGRPTSVTKLARVEAGAPGDVT